MSQVLTMAENILKKKYLPAFRNQLTTDPSPFMEKIKKGELHNFKVIGGAPVGFNGGFGFGSDDSATPRAGGQKYTQFELPAKDMYCSIEISDKVIKLGTTDQAAMLNVLDQEVRSAFAVTNWNIGRSLFGDGTGVIGHITASAASGTYTYTLADVHNVREGLILDVYNFSAATGTGTETKAGQVRVTGVNRATKVITCELLSQNAFGCTTKRTADAEHGKTDDYGFVTVQNSLDAEICGIGAIMGSGNIYGMTSRPDWSKPLVIDANHGIDSDGDIILYDGIKQALDYRNTKIDMLLCGDTAFKQYQTYCRAKNTVIVGETMEFKGGAVGYTMIVGSQKVVVVNEKFVPANEIWGVCTADWKFDSTPLDFADEHSVPFVLEADKSIYRALLATYGNLMCDVPGGCVRFTNCDA